MNNVELASMNNVELTNVNNVELASMNKVVLVSMNKVVLTSIWTTLSTMLFSRDNNVVTPFFSHQCCNNLLTCQQQRTWLFYQYKLSLFPWTTLLLHHCSTMLLTQCWTILLDHRWSRFDHVLLCLQVKGTKSKWRTSFRTSPKRRRCSKTHSQRQWLAHIYRRPRRFKILLIKIFQVSPYELVLSALGDIRYESEFNYRYYDHIRWVVKNIVLYIFDEKFIFWCRRQYFMNDSQMTWIVIVNIQWARLENKRFKLKL